MMALSDLPSGPVIVCNQGARGILNAALDTGILDLSDYR